jgi:hypothetical protein
MQPNSPLPDIAVELDNDHVQLHNDARAYLQELGEADLQSQEEVNQQLGAGWVYRLLYSPDTQSYPARNPVAKFHDYVGPVQPSDMVPGDSWADYSAS